MVKVLLFGAQGQLGSAFRRSFSCHNDLKITSISRAELDLCSDRSLVKRGLERIVTSQSPRLIINAAAFTAVDRAETEIDQAFQVNAWFPGELAKLAEKSAAQLIHFSSDYVFDGELSDRAYRESDECNPQSVYGRSKLEGEQAVLSNASNAWVIRTSWVVGSDGQNFAKTMLRLACERMSLRVVADQFGVPTAADFLAKQVTEAWFSQVKGTKGGLYHLCPGGETNWHAYACWVISRAANHPRWKDRLQLKDSSSIEAIETAAYPTKAKRPKNSRLDCSHWCSDFRQGVFPDWRDALIPTLERILITD